MRRDEVTFQLVLPLASPQHGSAAERLTSFRDKVRESVCAHFNAGVIKRNEACARTIHSTTISIVSRARREVQHRDRELESERV